MKKWTLFSSVTLVGLVMAVSFTSAQAQTQTRFVYSVKFLCGIQSNGVVRPPFEPPVKPGNYATAINIHNFHQVGDALFCKNAVAALPENVSRSQPGNFVNLALKPGQALEVDCSDIVKLLPPSPVVPPFIKGFVEIRSSQLLNVVAVYTSQVCHEPGNVPRCLEELGELALEVVPQTFFPETGSCPLT